MHRGLGALALFLLVVAIGSLGAGVCSLIVRSDVAAFYCLGLSLAVLRACSSIAEAGKG